jgi:hypothetical protein
MKACKSLEYETIGESVREGDSFIWQRAMFREAKFNSKKKKDERDLG